MSNCDLDDEDVLFLGRSIPFLGEATTFKVDQMKTTLMNQFITLTSNNESAMNWLQKGFDCKLLSATQGCGWRKGKYARRA
jgi:hypothetical protein